MQLRPDQTQRFYHIWFPLLHYVNEQRQLTTAFPDTPEEGSITQNDAMQLRDALWADDELREKFIAFAKTYLLGQEPPKGLFDTRIEDVKAYFHSAGNKINTVSFKRFVRFLSETGRMDYEQAESLRDFLRHAGE